MKLPGRLQAYHQDKANYQYTVFTTSRKIYKEKLAEKFMINSGEEDVDKFMKEEMGDDKKAVKTTKGDQRVKVVSKSDVDHTYKEDPKIEKPDIKPGSAVPQTGSRVIVYEVFLWHNFKLYDITEVVSTDEESYLNKPNVVCLFSSSKDSGGSN